MLVNYRIEKLKRIMNDLYVLTGINFAILDTNFHPVYCCDKETPFCAMIQKTAIGANKCLCSDADLLEECRKKRAFCSHTCHAGLIDAAIPIMKNDITVGYIVMGQLRASFTDKEIRQKLSWMKEDIDKTVDLYQHLPQFSDSQMESLNHLLSHILFEDAIEIDYNDFITFATTYIKDNLNKDLRISDLCSTLHVSKNFIYRSFRENRGCTVNEYINKQRINQAQKRIRETGEPIYMIAESVGIPNYTYFCRLFKKMTGLSPKDYRNSI